MLELAFPKGAAGTFAWSQIRSIPGLPPRPSNDELADTILRRLVRDHLEELAGAGSHRDFMECAPRHFMGIVSKFMALAELAPRPAAPEIHETAVEALADAVGRRLDEVFDLADTWTDALASSLRTTERVRRVAARLQKRGLDALHEEGVAQANVALLYWLAGWSMALGIARFDLATTESARRATWFCLTDGPREAYAILRGIEMDAEDDEDTQESLPTDPSPLEAEMDALDADTDCRRGVE